MAEQSNFSDSINGLLISLRRADDYRANDRMSNLFNRD